MTCTKGHRRKAYRRADGTYVKATYVKPRCTKKNDKWMQAVDKEMEKKGTVGSFTRAKLAAGYANTPAGTVRFANAVLAGKIKGKNTPKWHDRAALAKVFVRESRKR